VANSGKDPSGVVFERLIGLETEYALQVPAGAVKRAGGRYQIFRDLVSALRGITPVVDARHMKEGVFHASGGAVWFETERPAAGGGLIEGATPECRSPRQLLAWQRAQDELLSEAAHRAFGRQIRLLKNDRDAKGNVYGAQENYEATFATGARLWIWRVGLVLMLPLVLASWALLWLLALLIVLYTIVASLVYLVGERFVRDPDELARFLFGCEFDQLGQAAPTGPAWLEAWLSTITRVLTAPLAGVFYLLLWATAFTRLRANLLPFLISRTIVCGSGMLDNAGRFLLADKAPAMNCLTGYGGLLGDRPIFTFGHFFKTVYADAWMSPREYLRLFARTHRLQIALGDSNLAEPAEYLRIGTTLLVIDCIEAGEMPRPPRVRRPLRALRAICADPTLTTRLPLGDGQSCSALELQRFYLEACRRFLERRPEAPREAREVLRRWEATLDALQDDPESLVGSLDWVTKRFVLQTAGRDATWQMRKKIDLRYHELSPQGYFQQLNAAGVAEHILEPSEIELARRNPPVGTPASARGRYIREFACGDEPVSANWKCVFIGQGRKAKVIRLGDYRRLPPSKAPSSAAEAQEEDAE
jgi:hypothetical protein